MCVHQPCKHACGDGRLAAGTACNRLSDALQELTKSVPSSYELVAQRKGFNRYMTPRLRELVSEHKAALEDREKAAGCILQVTCSGHIPFRASFVWGLGVLKSMLGPISIQCQQCRHLPLRLWGRVQLPHGHMSML